MESASPPRGRVPDRDGPSLRRAGLVRGRWRRRPAGEPPPLPHRLGMTGWWWLGLGTIAIFGSTIAVGAGRAVLLPVDQRVLEGLAGLRTPALTRAMVLVAALGSQWMIVALGWATVLVLLAVRRY